MYHSECILSDSGGECEEAAYMSKNIIVLRHETERPELFEYNQMVLTGTDTQAILDGYKTLQITGKRNGLPKEYSYESSKLISNLCFKLLNT